MTIKHFTAEGRFECGLDEIVRGKVWAFTAVIGEKVPFRLAVVIANEPGYLPIPEAWCHSDDRMALAHHAVELNRAAGLDERTAAKIVASTMRAAPPARRKPKGAKR